MLPIVKLSQAWVEREGFSNATGAASFFDLDLAGAVAADTGDKCPTCTRHHAEYYISVFVPDVASATPERVEGRAYVLCLCRTMYWYAAFHAVDARQPVGSAEVRAAVKPEPVVTEHVTASDVAAVVINESLPPGRFISSDSAAAFARWYKPDASRYFSPRSSSEPPPEQPK